MHTGDTISCLPGIKPPAVPLKSMDVLKGTAGLIANQLKKLIPFPKVLKSAKTHAPV